MFSFRAEWTLGLAALVAGSAVAGEASPNDGIAKLGLKQAGVMLLLESESEIHTKVDALRQPAMDLNNALMRQRSTVSEAEYQATIKQLNAEISAFQSELKTANQMGSQVPRIRGRIVNNVAREQLNEINAYKKQLQWEVDQRQTFLKQLRSQPFDKKAKDKIDAEVKEKRDALQTAVHEARELVDTANDRYTQLAKNPEFKKALSTLDKKTRSAHLLGPSRQFRDDAKFLERVEGLASGEQAKPNTTRSRAKAKGKRSAAKGNDPF